MLQRKNFSTGKTECDNTMIPMPQINSVTVQSLPLACTSSQKEVLHQWKPCESLPVSKSKINYNPLHLQKITKMLKSCCLRQEFGNVGNSESKKI